MFIVIKIVSINFASVGLIGCIICPNQFSRVNQNGFSLILFAWDRVGDKTVEILLLSAFKIRYKEILTKAYTAAYTATSKFLTLLTKEETNCESFSC